MQIEDSKMVIDFFKFIHRPQPDIFKTYLEHGMYMWEDAILKHGFDHGTRIVTLVIDFPKSLISSTVRES